MQRVARKNVFSGRGGSALVIVVVLTVLLSTIGMFFVMRARIDQLSTVSIAQQYDLDSGVDVVVSQIKGLLVADLFDSVADATVEDVHLFSGPTATGTRANYGVSDYIANEPWDAPWSNIPLIRGEKDDTWLASVEPELVDDKGTADDPSDDLYKWAHITDLYGDRFGIPSGSPYYDPEDDSDASQWTPGPGSREYIVRAENVIARIIANDDRLRVIKGGAAVTGWDDETWTYAAGARADADGDGVADSRWIILPDVTGSTGKDIYAAVRIVDNCAMLNLNAAHSINADSQGKYLSEIDYERFLRGDDRGEDPLDPHPEYKDRIRWARRWDGSIDPVDVYHDQVIMNIENPGASYGLFEIGDELEIRNRFMLTSLVQSRFEHEFISYFTFDLGHGGFVGTGNAFLKSHRVPFDNTSFEAWKWRMDHRNFDDKSGAYVGPPPSLNPNYRWAYDRRHICTFYSFETPRRREYPLIDPSAAGSEVDLTKIDTVLSGAGTVFIPADGGAFGLNNLKFENTVESRDQMVYLLYGLRAYFAERYADDPADPAKHHEEAARRAAQVVVNMIDYSDNEAAHTPGDHEGPFFNPGFDPENSPIVGQSNVNPTYLTKEIVRRMIMGASARALGPANRIDINLASNAEYDFGLSATDIIYGFERQPFITEVYYRVTGGSVDGVGIEIINPYNADFDLMGWRITIGVTNYDFSIFFPGGIIPARTRLVLRTDASVPVNLLEGATIIEEPSLTLIAGDVIKLERRDPASAVGYMVVDQTQAFLVLPGQDDTNGDHVSKRDDTEWKFTDSSAFTPPRFDTNHTLGVKNGVTLVANGLQMPVANNYPGFGWLGSFEKVLFAGNEKGAITWKPVTETVAAAASEGDLRLDVATAPEFMEYFSFMNRAPNGRSGLAGRININTATKEVISAAIVPGAGWVPDSNDLGENVVSYRDVNGPFEHVNELLNVSGFMQFADEGSDPNDIVGDPEMFGDIEARNWILSKVSNIFTVRSDVFTAYILVRVGTDGLQKRMIAIFDRREVFGPNDQPRLVALHPVPDVR